MTIAATDFAAIKAKQQAMWATGDFAMLGSRIAIVGEALCEAVDLAAGSKVLDVACGAGTATIAAARRFADVVGIDFVPELLQRGREIAAAERLDARFQEGDAEHLPFADGTFDSVLSTFGVMFAPDQPQAAAELLRVCRSGGTIGLVNWTPESFAGQLFAVTGQYMPPPPPGIQPPLRWGMEAGVRDLLGDGVRDLQLTRRHVVFRYRSEDHMLDMFRTYFGPVAVTHAALDDAAAAAYMDELRTAIRGFNRRRDGIVAIDAEYLETVATRV